MFTITNLTIEGVGVRLIGVGGRNRNGMEVVRVCEEAGKKNPRPFEGARMGGERGSLGGSGKVSGLVAAASGDEREACEGEEEGGGGGGRLWDGRWVRWTWV